MEAGITFFCLFLFLFLASFKSVSMRQSQVEEELVVLALKFESPDYKQQDSCLMDAREIKMSA